MFINVKFFERFSSIFYLICLASLVGLFVFGTTVSGATSWYSIGSFSLQPAEFAKAITALALAKLLSDIHTSLKKVTDQMYAFLIILLPVLLIIPQPDPGSALVFLGLLMVLYREGLPSLYMWTLVIMVVLFLLTLYLTPFIVSLILTTLFLIFIFTYGKKGKMIFKSIIILFSCIGFAYSVNYIFNEVFEQRHRDRINIVLGKATDTRGIGYNTNQSEIAIGSGRWLGKGFLQGTQTEGNFVPEQHTDYIFSTVGEEWGFLGGVFVVVLFVFLLLRILFISERQKNDFSRIYGYGVASILFVHIGFNLGMVLGLIPTIGIPLPFFSYGGSSLLGFTILLAILIKLDSNRVNEW
jgi:rod shape determining protein RodA